MSEEAAAPAASVAAVPAEAPDDERSACTVSVALAADPAATTVYVCHQSLSHLLVVVAKTLQLLMMVTFLCLLLAARKALSTEEETRLSAALGFLHREFEPRYFWWEILEVVKKLVLVGFAAIILPGSVTQLIVAFVVSLLFLLLTAITLFFAVVGPVAAAVALRQADD